MQRNESRTSLKALAATLILLGAGLAPKAAHAQFSGPALGATVDTNKPQQPTTDPAILMPGVRDPILGIGDLISVRVFGAAEYGTTTRIASDGFVELPLIGLIKLSGLTLNHAQDLIATQLKAAGMYLDPQVNIQVTESVTQTASVTGELHAVVPIVGDRRLFDVLAAAGSMPVTASHTIVILRPGVTDPIIVELGTDASHAASADIPILPGDKIIVSRVGVVYMLGAFHTQGAIPLQQNAPLTLMQAAALSQGAGWEGKFNDLRIVRTVGLTRTVVKLDISKVLKGTVPDPVLQADDIVFLPSDAIKAAIKSGGINTITSIVSLLILAKGTGF